ncbi:hypothetical protein CMQ_1444 [Grosmannia clavigera kw1407]|uniref:DNA polymerase delta subunit 3 n=1 Tax=Grosmannia clavigera (strain kw1407 / UAMH 11150) TaxID=655863 RepID=F0XES1_GROCL|nr:uncharacterized protein CMQ_1444 [Grosmannia clavigera kw1407]EFX04516.1 hypothetical protein CMQ_1444 [Grosmannia clavigera kw1407]
MEKAAEYLADEVLAEKHVNVKKPGSVHATYLLYGTKPVEKPSHHEHADFDEGNVYMDGQYSEGEMFSDPFPTVSMTLVAEEALEESIHVYSLSSQPMSVGIFRISWWSMSALLTMAQDLQLLADSTRKLRELTGADVSDSSKVYGTIHNPHVRRRQRKGQAPTLVSRPSTKPASKPTLAPTDSPGPQSIWNKVAKSATKDTKEEGKTDKPSVDAPGPNSIWNRVAKTKDAEKTAGETAPAPAASSAETTKSSTPAIAKKTSSGGIMQAFAKGAAAAKPKKKEPVVVAKEDTAMALSDDGGDDDDDELLPKPQTGHGVKSRKEREEELLKMMEEDDDEEKSEEDEKEGENALMEDLLEDTEEPSAPEAPEKEEITEVISTTTGDGRRRGKRRVMRKKMIEDEGGYLVTIQEPGWESFSEDEAPPPKPAQPAKPAQKSHSTTPAAKAKKPAGQGSIMSFFSKK